MNPTAGQPLYQQLYEGIRSAILSGRLAGGTRLPSTRALAQELGLSRSTVINAFDQLLAEGYVYGLHGSGTYVARVLPDELLRAQPEQQRRLPASERDGAISRRGAALADLPGLAASDQLGERAFQVGLPAIDEFPRKLWGQALARCWRAAPDLLGYQHPAGYLPLRQAIAAHVTTARGVRCIAEQVIVTAGSQQGLALAAQVLLDPGDAAWIEDPGYMGARAALLAAGARLVTVPIDSAGLDLAAGLERHASPRLVYVTPSHQFPLGVTMSLARRLALLEWAAKAGAWLIEDDYDSEFHYAGRPLPALQGLDSAGRVIYIGTFSKVLFPALRLGYLIAPPGLVGAFLSARSAAGTHSPALEQAVLAEFMRVGHFARHIRRMRALYAERQVILLDAAARDLVGLLDLQPSTTGMHLLGWLPARVDDREAATRAAAAGVQAMPLSRLRIEPDERGALLLGYAAADERAIRESVRRLAGALHMLSR
ncbi:MAG TPA: PLP-dependent aminotransferase family protein [Roseiflexaceae bacterium]|nr:PLP-dependent aminotransferase family protein [Roseiflexaceae bacterium]